jgi:hypothetical protein
VRDKAAAIKIFDANKNDEYIDGVGSEELGNLVVVPWQSHWSNRDWLMTSQLN